MFWLRNIFTVFPKIENYIPEFYELREKWKQEDKLDWPTLGSGAVWWNSGRTVRVKFLNELLTVLMDKETKLK
jgi:hypothetical protein